MAIDSPATYSDWYWKHYVDATRAIAAETEAELSGTAARLMARLGIREVLPPELSGLFSEIEAPAGAFLSEVGGRFVSEVADGAVSKTASPLLESIGYLSYMKWPTKKITVDATAKLFSRRRIQEDFFNERFSMGGFEPTEARFQYESMMPYPSIPDFILFARYHGSPDNTRELVWDWFDVPARDYEVWEWLQLQRLTTLQVQTLYRRGAITESQLFSELAKIGWSGSDRPLITELGWTIPNAMLLVQGDLQQKKSPADIIRDISIADINPSYAQQYLDAVLTKPASQDIVAYELRKDPSLAGLDARLKQIGIHPDHIDVYKTLAYPIPPVADIITMAVREAFTPAVAAKFGQYEDYPPEFEQWAMKKGLSADWSKRYWAAHWSLPSPQQGFEMLHRGIITEPELQMLLRALDIMPFWRDKLTKMAYRRLTRVDIRRMYGVGVLNETEVYDAYTEQGYNERDARRMSDFTVRQILASQSKFTASDIVAGYSKYMINASEARSLLELVGVRKENIAFIITTADYKRTWELTDSKISAIRNLYKRKTYSDSKARSELLKLDLPAERVDVLMEQWYIDEKDKPERYWTTAQTLSFMKEGLITETRGRKELVDLGYDAEHINIYIKASE